MGATLQYPISYSVSRPQVIGIPLMYSVITQEDKERESTKRNKDHFLDILEKTRGVISIVCQQTNIGRSTYYYWRNSDPEFASKVDEILHDRADVLEDRIFVAAHGGDMKAAMYLLDRYRYRKEKQPKTESTVHIFHHTDRPMEQQEMRTFEDIIYDQARKSYELKTGKKFVDGEDFKNSKSV